MRAPLLLALAAPILHAAVIRGSVVENQTGHPLARALVTLLPVTGTPATKQSLRTDRYGAFEFPQLPAGAYLLTAARTGFVTAQYGQKQWKSSGVPVPVAVDDSYTVSIRLWRYAAISGTVLDENDVGLPEHEVVAYRNTRPPQPVTRAKTDDRGIFRIYGLDPGSYLMRTAAKHYDEGDYLPTFSKETDIVDQAYPVEVSLDQQLDRIDVRPLPGRLFSLSVQAIAFPINAIPPPPVTLTLVSDIGRQTVQTATYRFTDLPPGPYELFAEAPVPGRTGVQGEYQRIAIAKDTPVSMSLQQVPELQFVFEGAPDPAGNIQVLARRKDLAGPGPVETLKLANNRVQLAVGRWELAIPPNPAYYVANFSGPRHQRPADGHTEGWNEIAVGYGGPTVRFTLSTTPGSLRGAVRSAQQPVAGAPVFLEPVDLDPQRRVTDTFVTRTDLQGQYQFTGLAPGNYRVLSSFEYQMPDSATMANARAIPIKVDERHTAQQDLDLYVIP